MKRATSLALIATAATGAFPTSTGAQSTAAIRVAGGGTTEPYMVPYFARDENFFVRAGLNVDLLLSRQWLQARKPSSRALRM